MSEAARRGDDPPSTDDLVDMVASLQGEQGIAAACGEPTRWRVGSRRRWSRRLAMCAFCARSVGRAGEDAVAAGSPVVLYDAESRPS